MKPHYKLVRADRVKPGDNILWLGRTAIVGSVEPVGIDRTLIMLKGLDDFLGYGWNYDTLMNDAYVAVRGAK